MLQQDCDSVVTRATTKRLTAFPNILNGTELSAHGVLKQHSDFI